MALHHSQGLIQQSFTPITIQQHLPHQWTCPHQWVSGHRSIEWFGLEGTIKGHLLQLPCHEQGHLPLDQVAQNPIQPDLECFLVTGSGTQTEDHWPQLTNHQPKPCRRTLGCEGRSFASVAQLPSCTSCSSCRSSCCPVTHMSLHLNRAARVGLISPQCVL